jgi:hypothetical protein
MQPNKSRTRPAQKVAEALNRACRLGLVANRNALNQNVFEFIPAPQSQPVKSRARWCLGASKILAIRDLAFQGLALQGPGIQGTFLG